VRGSATADTIGDMVEVVGPLDTPRLARLLEAMNIRSDAYALSGDHPSECYVMDHRGHEWTVYYSERGSESGLETFRSEDLACRHLLDLVARDKTVHR
jgi:hypothetical protein